MREINPFGRPWSISCMPFSIYFFLSFRNLFAFIPVTLLILGILEAVNLTLLDLAFVGLTWTVYTLAMVSFFFPYAYPLYELAAMFDDHTHPVYLLGLFLKLSSSTPLRVPMVMIPVIPYVSTRTLNPDEFAKWLSGFSDGEATFVAYFPNGKLRIGFQIRIHIDDIKVLYKIQSYLGVGTVSFSVVGSWCTFNVSRLADLYGVILPLFTANPLLTTKRLDFESWATIVRMLVAAKGTPNLTEADLKLVQELVGGMNSTRTDFTPAKITAADINPFWLLGFYEAEGHLGVTFNHPYLSVSQKYTSVAVLEAIASFLKALPNNGPSTLGPISVSRMLNRRTGVWSYTIGSTDTLWYVIMPFLLSMPWQSRKGVDFQQWCLALYLYHTGRAYTLKGRKLLEAIRAYINDGRYSNHLPAPVGPPSADLIKTVLDLPVPMVRPAGMNQTDFAKAIARLFPRVVYVYDHGVLMPGSPFPRISHACKAVGLPATSRLVSKYMDTDTAYANQYTFTSVPRQNSM